MKKILIVKFGALGDVVRTTFFLSGLKKKNFTIYFLTANSSFELLRYNPHIDQIILPSLNLSIIYEHEFDHVYSLDDEKEILSLVQKVTTQNYTGAFLDTNGLSHYTKNSATWFDMGLLSRYGKDEADRLKKINQQTHAEIFQTIFQTQANAEFFNAPHIEHQIKTYLKSLINNEKIIKIGINSGAGERWESKALPIKEVIKLIELILAIPEPRIHIFLFGGAQELNRHQTITQAIPSPRLIDTGNHHQLLEFAALIKQMDYLISSDSLALHLAIAQQVKNLSFYAPTSAVEIDTFGTGVKVISSGPDYCNYKKEARKNDLTAEKIFATFQSWVKSP